MNAFRIVLIAVLFAATNYRIWMDLKEYFLPNWELGYVPTATTTPPARDCLVVYHIPKTGGTSLGSLLIQVEKALGWEYDASWYNHYERFGNATPRTDYTHEAIHAGHFTGQFASLTHTEHCYAMTILRKPVDRVISAFYYHKHRTPEWEACLDNDRKCRHAFQYHNDMTRQLSNQTETWNTYDEDVFGLLSPDETSLEAAKSFLSTMDLVCFLDEFDQCCERLMDLLQVEGLRIPPKRNANRARPQELNATIMERIQYNNQLDAQLYEWAERQFRITAD